MRLSNVFPDLDLNKNGQVFLSHQQIKHLTPKAAWLYNIEMSLFMYNDIDSGVFLKVDTCRCFTGSISLNEV